MIKKINYPDGSFYPKIEEFIKIITFKINSYDDLWFLRQIKDVYDYNNKPLSIIIPNLIDAQADRRFNTNEPSNLKLVCEFLNSMKFEEIFVFHPHNPEVVEALIPNVKIIDNTSFIMDGVLEQIGEWGSNDFNTILMSSDAGGFKTLMKLADKIQWKGETFSASKSRKFEDDKSKLIQQIDKEDFNGKDILIIDDLCVYGGTFIGLANLLKNKNIGKLYLAISHITVPNPKKELEVFDQIFTTNSKYENYELDNLTVIKQW